MAARGKDAMRPYENLRVVDLGQGYGAIPGMILADYGADVIKVEPPTGELFRSHPAFVQWNRGKRGVILDLHDCSHRERLDLLLGDADVLIHNFRPATATNFGLCEDRLRPLAPQLIHVSITGFGPGRRPSMKAYEGVVAAACGQYAIQNGYRTDGPIYDAIPKCSFGAAMLALIGALAALDARDSTGLGQTVETSLLQANFNYSFLGITSDDSPLLSQVQGRDPHNNLPGYRIAECADGKWIQSGSATGRTFGNMLAALGIQRDSDEGLTSVGNADLLRLIDEAYRTKPLAAWVEELEKHDAGYGLFMTTQEFMDYPQVRHNGHVVETVDPVLGSTQQVGPLVKFVDSAWEHPGPAPELGDSGSARFERPRMRAVSTARGPTSAALSGLTILDLSTFGAAPGGSGHLADLGARVIKVEPLTGDPMGQHPNEMFFRTNRGKERIAIDLKRAEGRDILHRLVKRSDVLLHNFRPGVPERLGADFDTLTNINDQLVYVYAASFGSSGPDAHRPAFDPVVSAMAGGEVLQAGEGNPPQQRQSTDHSAMLAVAVAILLGVRARNLTQQAQRIETTMLASAAYLLSDDFIRYDGKPPRPVPDKGQHGLSALYRLYPAADSTWMFLACVQDDEWARLCAAIDCHHLLVDERFATAEARCANDDALVEILGELFSQRSADRWVALFDDWDVACVEPAASWTDVLLGPSSDFEPPFVTEFQWPGIGRVRQSGANVVLSASPSPIRPPEVFAASTKKVLLELGFDDPAVDDLATRGVIHLSSPRPD